MDASLVINILSSVVLVILGFLLNRVFGEIDGLRKADECLAAADAALARAIADLRPTLIDREYFDRHVDREERLISTIQHAIDEQRQLLVEMSMRLTGHAPREKDG